MTPEEVSALVARAEKLIDILDLQFGGQQVMTSTEIAHAHDLFERIRQALTAQAQALTALREERDLAIAHDRQPYPTAHAYEQACKALTALREERDAWRRTCERITEERNEALTAKDAEMQRVLAAATLQNEVAERALAESVAKDAEIEKLRERERRYENAECVTCGRDLTSQREAQ